MASCYINFEKWLFLHFDFWGFAWQLCFFGKWLTLNTRRGSIQVREKLWFNHNRNHFTCKTLVYTQNCKKSFSYSSFILFTIHLSNGVFWRNVSHAKAAKKGLARLMLYDSLLRMDYGRKPIGNFNIRNYREEIFGLIWYHTIFLTWHLVNPMSNWIGFSLDFLCSFSQLFCSGKNWIVAHEKILIFIPLKVKKITVISYQ